jgi:hypothetical protein
MAKRGEDPFRGMGVAACVLMEATLTAMARAGQEEAALAIISGALAYFGNESFRRSSVMRDARARVERLADAVKQLARTGDATFQ